MGKKKAQTGTDVAVTEDMPEKGNFRIQYMQGDEQIELSFHDAERRDHEYSRLVSTGHILIRKVDTEAAEAETVTE